MDSEASPIETSIIKIRSEQLDTFRDVRILEFEESLAQELGCILAADRQTIREWLQAAIAEAQRHGVSSEAEIRRLLLAMRRCESVGKDYRSILEDPDWTPSAKVALVEAEAGPGAE